MKAKLTITFEDGTQKTIELVNAIAIDLSHERKQSIEFRETKSGKWVMSYTKPVFEGKKISTIKFEKV